MMNTLFCILVAVSWAVLNLQRGPPKLPPAPEKEFKKRTESQVQISAGVDPHRFPHCKVIKYTRDCLKANTAAEY